MGQIPAGEGAEGSTIWSNDSTTASKSPPIPAYYSD
jgi:hypothetical protein